MKEEFYRFKFEGDLYQVPKKEIPNIKKNLIELHNNASDNLDECYSFESDVQKMKDDELLSWACENSLLDDFKTTDSSK